MSVGVKIFIVPSTVVTYVILDTECRNSCLGEGKHALRGEFISELYGKGWICMNLDIGRMPHGGRNLITDVPGVRVGHTTIDRGNCHTGVTVVLPPPRNP